MAGFIKFDGVDGESKDDKHKGWSDLVSFTQPITRPATGTGAHRRRGDVVMHDVTIVKEIDKSTPKLAESIVKGKVWPKVEIHLTASYTDSSRVTYYAYELKNVQVNNYNIGGSSQAEDVVTEEMSLNFEEIKVTYTENDAAGKKKGNVEYSWKVEEGAQ
jgi:type VI secretion system secreted protein Hcp